MFLSWVRRAKHPASQLFPTEYKVVMHGVSLSIGSTDPLNFDYLAKLKVLADWTKAAWISDHVCWTGVNGLNGHDLLPLPYNEETLQHVVSRIKTVQDFLERPLVLENPSTYVTFTDSTMSEWDFVTRMAEESDCGLLLDVNNVYVSCFNHDLDPEDFIRSLPHERIVQFHLAGHTDCGTHIIDTHDNFVVDKVWELYHLAHKLTGGVSTLLEWDAQIPDFDVVHSEVLKARDLIRDGGSLPTAKPREVTKSAVREGGSSEDVARPTTVPQPAVFVSAEVE